MDVFFRIAVHFDSTAMQTDVISWTLSSRDGRHGCKYLGRVVEKGGGKSGDLDEPL